MGIGTIAKDGAELGAKAGLTAVGVPAPVANAVVNVGSDLVQKGVDATKDDDKKKKKHDIQSPSIQATDIAKILGNSGVTSAGADISGAPTSGLSPDLAKEALDIGKSLG